MDKRFVWATEDIFKDTEEWNRVYAEIEGKIDFSEFKGKLGNAEDFLACMKKQEDLGRVVEKLGVYAMMLHDGDTRNSEYDALVSRVTTLSVKFGEKTAFITPELTALDEKVKKK